MPIRTSKEAPRFQGSASGLERYIEDIELLCADRQKSGDAELIRWAIYYTDEKSSDTWVATRDALESPKTWEDFKKAIQDIYPEAQPDRRHTISALRAITDRFQAQGVNSEMVLAEYFREFSSTANYLVSKHRMTKCEASILFISSFPKEFRADITTQLTIKCPDVCPDDGYNLKDMDSAAQFVSYYPASSDTSASLSSHDVQLCSTDPRPHCCSVSSDTDTASNICCPAVHASPAILRLPLLWCLRTHHARVSG